MVAKSGIQSSKSSKKTNQKKTAEPNKTEVRLIKVAKKCRFGTQPLHFRAPPHSWDTHYQILIATLLSNNKESLKFRRRRSRVTVLRLLSLSVSLSVGSPRVHQGELTGCNVPWKLGRLVYWSRTYLWDSLKDSLKDHWVHFPWLGRPLQCWIACPLPAHACWWGDSV